MLDFNSKDALSERVNTLIDVALEARHAATPRRNYLGGSRLGANC